MVYRGMDIGTAKPSPEVLESIPHALIDICDPTEPYNAYRFTEDALNHCRRSWSAGRVPLLVGGTMLYFKALQDGMSPLPSSTPESRAPILLKAKEHGWAAMHSELMAVDERAAEKIHPNDPQRITRALEVYQLTGKPFSEWLDLESNKPNVTWLNLALVSSNREILHSRIARRYESMLESGLVDEVENLLLDFKQRKISKENILQLPSMRAVGYRQLVDYLSGSVTLSEAKERAIIATRQLAKRQMTWLRSWPSTQIFDCMLENMSQSINLYLTSQQKLW
jgi:tRNA dimethylallyltransferase